MPQRPLYNKQERNALMWYRVAHAFEVEEKIDRPNVQFDDPHDMIDIKFHVFFRNSFFDLYSCVLNYKNNSVDLRYTLEEMF